MLASGTARMRADRRVVRMAGREVDISVLVNRGDRRRSRDTPMRIFAGSTRGARLPAVHAAAKA
jgi:hypothetical protein